MAQGSPLYLLSHHMSPDIINDMRMACTFLPYQWGILPTFLFFIAYSEPVCILRRGVAHIDSNYF